MMLSDQRMVNWMMNPGVGMTDAVRVSLLDCAYGAYNFESCVTRYEQFSAFPVNLSWYLHALQMRSVIPHITSQKYGIAMAVQMDIWDTVEISIPRPVTFLEIISPARYQQPVHVQTQLDVPVIADREFPTTLDTSWGYNATFISGEHADRLRAFYSYNRQEGESDIVINFNNFSASDKVEVVLSRFEEGYPPGVYLSQPTAQRPYAQIALVDYTYQHYVLGVGRTLEQFNALPRTLINVAFAPGQKRDTQGLSLADIEFSSISYNPYRIAPIAQVHVPVQEGSLPLTVPPPPPSVQPEPIPAPEPEPVSPPSPMGGEPVPSPGFAPVPVPMPDQPQAPSPVIVAPPEPQLYTSAGTRPRPPFSEVMDIAWGLVGWVSRQATQKFLAPANVNTSPTVEVLSEVSELPVVSDIATTQPKPTVEMRVLSEAESALGISQLAHSFVSTLYATGRKIDAKAVEEVFARGEFTVEDNGNVTFSPDMQAELVSLVHDATVSQCLSHATVTGAQQFVKGFVEGLRISNPQTHARTLLAVEVGGVLSNAYVYGISGVPLSVARIVNDAVVKPYSPTIGGIAEHIIDVSSHCLMATIPTEVLAACTVAGALAKPLGRWTAQYWAQQTSGQELQKAV